MSYQVPAQNYGWRRKVVPWLLPLALLAMVLELGVLARLVTSDNAPRGSVAGVSQTAPAATAATNPTAAPTTAALPTTAAPPQAAAPAAVVPTAAAPTMAPPTATTARQPTPAPQTQANPVQPAAPAPAPAAAPPQEGPDRTTGPVAAVARFYQLTEQGQYDAAAALWSSRMRAEYPPAQNINGRFARSDTLMLQSIDLRSIDEANGRATVSIDLLEVLDNGVARRWVGSWYLVRGTAGWLLDQPSLTPA